MDPTKPPSIEDALRFDKNAIEADNVRRKQNIKLFQDQIAQEEVMIQWNNQVIAIQDANNKNK